MKKQRCKGNTGGCIVGNFKEYVKKNIDTLIFIAMILCYGMAIFSMLRPIPWRVGKNVQENVSSKIALTKKSYIKYTMPVSSTRIDEIQIYLGKSVIEGLSGKLQIDFYPENTQGETLHHEVDLREWQENAGSVYLWNVGDVLVRSGTYMMEFHIEDVAKKISDNRAILYLGIEEGAKYEQGELEINGATSSDRVKLAIETGGYKEEKTFAFDFLLLGGVLLLVYVIFAEENGGVLNENENK